MTLSVALQYRVINSLALSLLPTRMKGTKVQTLGAVACARPWITYMYISFACQLIESLPIRCQTCARPAS